MKGTSMIAALAALVFLSAVPTPAAANTVYTLDLTVTYQYSRADFYETAQLMAAFQGIVNRNGSNLYIFFTEADQFWMNYMRGDGEYLTNSTVVALPNLDAALQIFGSMINGAVAYDPTLPSLSNVASTVAGADNLLPFAQRTNPSNPTLFEQYVLSGRLPVQVWLNSSMFTGHETGSRKGDAYMWAVREYIETGKTDPTNMGFYLDYFWVTSSPCCGGGPTDYQMSTATNQDYFISKRGFIWDLNVWPDDIANDDPTAPAGTDLKTLQAIMLAAYTRTKGEALIHIGGFTPWAYKYVAPFGKHQGVDTEWQTVMVLSSYNAYLDGDACCIAVMANAAFYTHFPLQERYNPLPFPQKQDLINAGYLTSDGQVVPRMYAFWYAGDYDSAAWLYSQLTSKWDDPARGSIPIGWAVDSELSLRFPVIFKYLYDSRSRNDFFISGDSGAGYVNPTQYNVPRFSGLPDGSALWTDWNTKWFRKFGLSFSGFIINGYKPMTTEALNPYAKYSFNGATEQRNAPYPPYSLNSRTLPVFQEGADIVNMDTETAVKTMCSFNNPSMAGKPQFMMFRSILESASTMQNITATLPSMCPQLSMIDPHAMGYLARIALGSDNNNIATYLNDTIPRSARAGSSVRATIAVRNDGWNSLEVLDAKMFVEFVGTTVQTYAALVQSIEPGATANVAVTVTFPSAPGTYTLHYELVRSDAQPFKSYAWEALVTVV